MTNYPEGVTDNDFLKGEPDIDAISERYEPDEVFTKEQLHDWAVSQGYIHPDDL